MNKLVKLAMIRKDDLKPCPFGLSIPNGCILAGDLINKLAPIPTAENLPKEEKEKIINYNLNLFKWHAAGNRCPYAGKIFTKNNSVECDFQENGKEVDFVGSPFYAKHFSGVSLDGTYTVPIGSYVDNSIDRGHYYGIYSIESVASQEDQENTKKSSNK